MYIAKLDDIANKYNNAYRSTTKMKPVDVTSSLIDFNKKNNKEDPKFNVVDHVRISKYKNIFAKGIGLKKFLWMKKVKTLCCEHILLSILMMKKLLEKKLQK